VGFEPENGCAGTVQATIINHRPVVSLAKAPHIYKPAIDNNKNLVMDPKLVPDKRESGPQIVGRNITLTLNLTLYEAQTYAPPAWEEAADTWILELQRLQGRIFRAAGNLRSTPIGELYVAFKFPFIYDYITKSCRMQAEIILNHVNPN
jgi:hypothetical protein